MTKGIKQPDGTTCYKGADCRRHGQYNFFHGQVTISTLEKKTISPKVKPVIVEETKFHYPSDPKVTNVIEYEFDFYGCVGEDYYDEGICRCARYEGLRISELNGKTVVAYLLKVDEKDLPEDLVSQLEDLGFEDKDNYEITGEPDYYGQSAYAVAGYWLMDELRKWYFTQDNANDPDGILKYVRSKGTKTKNLTPLEAIKQQLKAENKGIINRLVEESKKAELVQLPLGDIQPANKTHYLKSEPLPPVPSVEKTEPVLGVVVKDGDKYILVDGNHRVKFANRNKTRKGNFIVLSS